MTISISADGEYRFDESSSHTLRCDGKERSIENNRALSCVKSSVIALDITLKENGAKTRATHDELSAGGKFFTTKVTEFRPNGPVVTSQITFSRLSGPNGFAGRWRDTSYLQQHTDMTLKLDGQTLHISYPSAGQQIEASLDGAETAVRGPRVVEGCTFAVRPAGRREFRTVIKRQGKLFSQGTLELSKDGRAIADSWWNPGSHLIKVRLSTKSSRSRLPDSLAVCGNCSSLSGTAPSQTAISLFLLISDAISILTALNRPCWI